MENQRIFLWAGLAFVLYLNYQAWVTDYAPAPAPPSVTSEETIAQPPAEPAAELPALPQREVEPQAEDEAIPTLTPSVPTGETIRVRTDVLDLEIDTRGGELVRAIALDYPVRKDEPDNPVQLLERSPDRFVIQSGFLTATGSPAPDHTAVFSTASTDYELSGDDDELTLRLEWNDGQGLSAVKSFTFRRGRYDIGLTQELRNDSTSDWAGAAYVQISRRHRELERSMLNVDTYSFRGPVVYNGDKYEKLDVDDLASEPVSGVWTDAWVAAIEHHFLAAAIPPPGEPASIEARFSEGSYLLSATTVAEVPAGESRVFTDILFVGPKVQDQLEETAKGLRLTVDYGWLTILAQPMFMALEFVHGLVRNWGWSIIIVTLLIKLIFYKLTEMSGRSMAKMRKLQPRMKLLQERYKDDREALSKAMMELYRKEKVNPVAGCLPMLIQIPVFLAFYWVLLESVELRQAPFALWIDDLSSRDPYFVLPLLMGAAMFVQFKLNPAPPDPVQAKVMMIMPIMMTALMAFFPSGLVLYWLTNTLLSILQQWRINRVVEADKKA